MLQIISAVIKDSEDKTNITLLFANQVNLKVFLHEKKNWYRVEPIKPRWLLKRGQTTGVYILSKKPGKIFTGFSHAQIYPYYIQEHLWLFMRFQCVIFPSEIMTMMNQQPFILRS